MKWTDSIAGQERLWALQLQMRFFSHINNESSLHLMFEFGGPKRLFLAWNSIEDNVLAWSTQAPQKLKTYIREV